MKYLLNSKNWKNTSDLFLFIMLFLVGSCTLQLDQKDINIFTDMTEELALKFHHNPGNAGEYHMSESIGSGVAIFDSNNDGLMDIYFLNGSGHEKNNTKKVP